MPNVWPNQLNRLHCLVGKLQASICVSRKKLNKLFWFDQTIIPLLFHDILHWQCNYTIRKCTSLKLIFNFIYNRVFWCELRCYATMNAFFWKITHTCYTVGVSNYHLCVQLIKERNLNKVYWYVKSSSIYIKGKYVKFKLQSWK